jgi:hypothetical protein
MRLVFAALVLSLFVLPAAAAPPPTIVAHPPVACGGCSKIPPTVCEVAAGCWHYGSFYAYGHPLCPKGQAFIGGACVTTRPVHRYGG